MPAGGGEDGVPVLPFVTPFVLSDRAMVSSG